MIAKKPKTAVCALIAVLMIGAVAVGCTFTGANRTEEKKSIEEDKQATEQVSLTIGEDAPSETDEVTEYVTLNVDNDVQSSMDEVAREVEAVTEEFVKTTMGEGYPEYEVVEWGIYEICEDGDALVGYCSFAYVPEDPDDPNVIAGNTRKGEGRYEGKYRCSRCFALEKKDGVWHGKVTGTGVYPLSLMSHRGQHFEIHYFEGEHHEDD